MEARESADEPSHVDDDASKAPADGNGAQANSPGLAARSVERLRSRSGDLVASVTGAVASVPDGMASSVIIGVSPVHGLYASAFGPFVGGIFARSPLLIVTTTSTGSLAASDVLAGQDQETLVETLFLLTVLAGALQVAASLAGLARLTVFVSHSVMIGFLTGIAVLILIGQLGDLIGYQPQGSNSVFKAVDTLRHLGEAHLQTAGIAGLTVLLAVGASRVKLGAVGALVAIAVPSALVAGLGWSDVQTVKDVSEIPGEFPLPRLPDLDTLSFGFVTGAFALAAVIFIQTAGVSQSLPGGKAGNGQGRDILASGLANVACGLFQGQPVGGSLSQSALNRSAGSQTRLAGILGGVWVLVIILLFAGLVESVVMPSLAALLVIAAVGAIRLGEAASIWRTSWPSRLSILVTFVATLFLPIQVAVAIGIALSALLYLASASADIAVYELVELPDGHEEERPPPQRLASDSVTVLQVYGSLFYAGARKFMRSLPDPSGSERAALILRLRGRTRLGATVLDLLATYARRLEERQGSLYLAGLSSELEEQIRRSGKFDVQGGVRLYEATSVVGASVQRALQDARAVQVRGSDDDD
jgi:SulP family sulfate permease